MMGIQAQNLHLGDFRIMPDGMKMKLLRVHRVGKSMVEHTYFCRERTLTVVKRLKRTTSIQATVNKDTERLLNTNDRNHPII